MTDTVKKPEVKVRGRRQNMEKKERAPKPKHSCFLLTINTNQQYKDDDAHLDDDVDIFDNVIADILKNVEHYVRLPETDKWDDEKIKSVDIDYVVERGGKKGQIHTHIMFKIAHFSKVQLNYAAIKKKICDELGLPNVYMYNKLLRCSSDTNIIDYLEKMV